MGQKGGFCRQICRQTPPPPPNIRILYSRAHSRKLVHCRNILRIMFNNTFVKRWILLHVYCKSTFFHASFFLTEFNYNMYNVIMFLKKYSTAMLLYVVYLGWPIAPSYVSPNTVGGEGVSQLMNTVQLSTWSPNKLWRSNSIFNLCFCTNALTETNINLFVRLIFVYCY